MPEKTGGGGHISEQYDPNTGQYVKNGSESKDSTDLGLPSDGSQLKSSILAFMKAKKEGTGTVNTGPTPISIWDFSKLVQNSVVTLPNGPIMNTKNLKFAFDKGTPEAQRLFCDFFDKFQNVKIARSNEKTCFSPSDNMLLIENAHLTGKGKLGGYISPGESLFHEFFHTIDWNHGNLTSNYQLQNGKTLKETFFDEIHDNYYSFNMKLFNEIKDGYLKDKESYLNQVHTPEEIANYNAKRKELYNQIMKMNQEFDNNPYHYPYLGAYEDAYKEYKQKVMGLNKEYTKLYDDFELPAKQKAQHKWIIMSDMCSFIYKTGTKGSICGGHPAQYWSQHHGNLPIMELFAEMGQKWATNETEGFNLIAKYFPKTADGFKELIGDIQKSYKK